MTAAVLTAVESAQREALLAGADRLAATMRVVDARVWRAAGWQSEVWLWVLWLRVSRGLALGTCAHYARTLLGFAEWVDANGLDYTAVSLSQLDAWQQHLWLARRNVVGVRATAVYALRSFYDWRKSRGFGADCTMGLRAPRLVKRTPRKYTKPQLRALFVAARQSTLPLVAMRNETMLAMLYATGMRREEIATLRLDQLEMEANVCIVRVFGKGAKEREVPIEGPAVRMLQAWIAERDRLQGIRTDAVFFTTRQNWFGYAMGVRAVESVVRTCAKRAGLGEWGVHRFRVTFATQLYDDGNDIERIRILMGHENIETTRHYIAVSTRMRGVRLKAFRQHEVLGTRPEGMPLWAQKIGEKAT
ncbi:MAG: tyrosine-type recombinase/integrase [Rudaea sp.]|nr:tyrosine-type recombinase/integrase [Rudaea sp.]